MQPRCLINSPALSEIFQNPRHLEELANSLAAFLASQRWFAAKTDGIQSVEILDSVEIPTAASTFELILASVVSNEGSSDCYAMPITSTLQNDVQSEDAIIARLSSGEGATGSPTSLVECSGDPEFWRAITTSLATRPLNTRNGRELKLSRTANSRLGSGEVFSDSEFTIHGGEQSNSAVAIGDQYFLKLFRRPRVGHNPDAEIGIFLTEQTDFKNSPQVEATFEISGDDGNRCLALISEQVSAETDAWTYTLNQLKDYWERLAALDNRPDVPPQLGDVSADAGQLHDLIGSFGSEVEQLGKRTAELHTALSSCDDDSAFAPEPLLQESLAQLITSIRSEVQSTCALLEKTDLPVANELPQKIRQRANRLLDEIISLDVDVAGAVNIRCHGDYHLGQVLKTDSDFIILDFEGEPDRPFDERRQKRSALKDVAGMIRSLHYASCAAAVGMLPAPASAITNPTGWQNFWYESARSRFLIGYRQQAENQQFLPQDGTVFQQLLDLFLIEKVLYELRYEINNRPDWVKIPLAGLTAVLGLAE